MTIRLADLLTRQIPPHDVAVERLLVGCLLREDLAFAVGGILRRGHRVVQDLRRAVTAAGDTAKAWTMAETAAILERNLLALEADVDEFLNRDASA